MNRRFPTTGEVLDESFLHGIGHTRFLQNLPRRKVTHSLAHHVPSISKALHGQIETSGFPCPYCRHTITVECLHASAKPKNNIYLDVRIAVKCRSCDGPFLLLATWNMDPSDGYYKIPPASQMNWKTKPESTDIVFAEQQQWQNAGVPQITIDDYIDGIRCMSVGIPKAAFLMFSSALERLFSAGKEEARKRLSEIISKHPDLPEDVRALATSGSEARNFYTHRVQPSLFEEQKEHAKHMSILVEYLAHEMYVRKSTAEKASEALDKMSGHKSKKYETGKYNGA